METLVKAESRAQTVAPSLRHSQAGDGCDHDHEHDGDDDDDGLEGCDDHDYEGRWRENLEHRRSQAGDDGDHDGDDDDDGDNYEGRSFSGLVWNHFWNYNGSLT